MRLAIPCVSLVLGMLSPAASTSSLAAAASAPTTARACSIAGDDIVRIASWDLELAYDRTAPDPDALSEFDAMIRMLDADVVALQGVTGGAKELSGSVQRLRELGRCYRALISPGGYATLYDPKDLELLYAESPELDCEGKSIASPTLRKSSTSDVQGQRQLSYFRVRSTDEQRKAAFDFVLLNVDIERAPEDLDRLAGLYNGLDRDYPWLAEERDRIILGDLGVDAARLTKDYFPQTKPLINLLLKINLGLSDKSFDEAVAASRSPQADDGQFDDNILVRRWDHPGTCAGPAYCGGLEEFVNARVYAPDKAGARTLRNIGKAVHPPIAARFCKFADSDPAAQAAR